jgi:hypothetical protein
MPPSSVADPDPGSDAFYPLDGSGIRGEFFPDSESRIPDPEGMFFGEIFLKGQSHEKVGEIRV